MILYFWLVLVEHTVKLITKSLNNRTKLANYFGIESVCRDF